METRSLQQHEIAGRRQKNFKRIWSLKIPKKVAIFLWKCMHNILPTRFELRRRPIIDEAYCTRCGQGAETVLHVLKDCMMASRGWECVGRTVDVGDLESWFEDELTSKENGRTWLFAATVYNLWWFRNIFVKKKEVMPLKEQYNMIMRFVVKYETSGTVGKSLNEVVTEWIPPKSGFTKINFDAAYIKKDNRGAIGIVAKDEAGDTAAHCAYLEHVDSPLAAEAWACLGALVFAKHLDLEMIVCEGDNLTVIDKMNIRDRNMSPIAAMMNDAKSLTSFFQRCHFAHIGR